MKIGRKGRLLSAVLSVALLFSFPVTQVTAADTAASNTSEFLPTTEVTVCESIPTEEYTLPTVLTASDDLQTQIDTLPGVDEVSSMTTDEQNEIYALVSAGWDAYYELSEDEQSEVDTTTLEALSDYFNGMTSATATYYAQIGDTKYTSLQSAIDAVGSENTTIQLIANVTVTTEITIPETANITLDLNGYTIQRNVSTTKSITSALVNNGILTIIDSSEAKSGKIYTYVTSSDTVDYYSAVIQNAGTLKLLGGTVELYDLKYTHTAYGIVNTTDGANVTVNGATIIVTNSADSFSTIGIYNLADNTSITMISGSVTVTSKANYPVKGLATTSGCSSSSITMSGGSITVDATRTSSSYASVVATGIDAESGSTTVTGGSITVSTERGTVYGVKANSDSPANINNLTLSVSSDATSTKASYNFMEYANIYGGTYTMAGTNTNTTIGTDVTIYGGTYSSNIASSLSTDYTTTENEDGTVAVTLSTFTLGISTDEEISISATVASGANTNTLYAEVSEASIGSYSKDAYPTTTLKFMGNDGEIHSYIFAGWYYKNGAGDYIAYGCDAADADYKTFGFNSTAYAKFVDATVLTVKVQITAGTVSSSTSTSLRIISSVDSLVYQGIAFDITFNNQTVTMTDTTAFEALSATGDVEAYEYAPSDIFSSASKYFITFTINGIPAAAFGYNFTIVPSWTTTDGTTVSGTERTISINDIIALLDKQNITNGSEQ